MIHRWKNPGRLGHAENWITILPAHEPGRGIGTLSPHEERVGREPERGALRCAEPLLSPALSSFLRQEERETRAIALPVQGFNARERVSGNSPHKPIPERGCVEDQPQRVRTVESAAAGAPPPGTQPRSGSGVQCANCFGEISPWGERDGPSPAVAGFGRAGGVRGNRTTSCPFTRTAPGTVELCEFSGRAGSCPRSL